jgi:heavy metal sensor kinase
MNTRSLRFRLAAWHALVLTAVFVLLGVLLFIQLEHYLENALLSTQARRARQIGETLVARLPRTGLPSLSAAVESLYEPEKNDRFIRITRKDGTLVYRSGPPLDLSFDPDAVPPDAPWPIDSENRRLATAEGDSLLISACRASSAGSGDYLVEVGTSAAPVEAMLRRLGLLLGLGLPLVVLVAAGGGYVLVQQALHPVAQIAGKAEMITQHNLSERLPIARTGDELERLSQSLNRMITRLDDAFRNSQRFVADASHELRTPLTVLRGELEQMAQFPGMPADLTERLGSLLEEVERLSKIVDRLLTLSRLDAGEAQAEWVRFDIAEMAATAASQMAQLAEDKAISVLCEVTQPVAVNGDRARLKQVVVNLLDNAIKYTPEGGSIQIRVSADDTMAVLEVADTGVGIPAEALPHIFERFFRVDKSRSRHPDGAGLGLAIVKSICSAHGGVVDAESEAGRGSRFRVKLPLAAMK